MGCPTTNPLNKLSLFRGYPEWANQCGFERSHTRGTPLISRAGKAIGNHQDSTSSDFPWFSYGFLSSITIFLCFFQPMIPSILKGRLFTTTRWCFRQPPIPVHSTMVTMRDGFIVHYSPSMINQTNQKRQHILTDYQLLYLSNHLLPTMQHIYIVSHTHIYIYIIYIYI